MKRKIKTRVSGLASGLLAAALLLTSCGRLDLPGEGTDGGTAPVQSTPQNLGLPAQTFGGRDFRIMAGYGARDVVFYPELTSNTINEAVHDRNIYIEETYDVHIRGVFSDSMAFDIQRSVNDGLAVCDIVEETLWNYAYLLNDGGLYDLNRVPYLDFTKAFWDGNCARNMSVAGALYFCTGDIMMSDKTGCWAVTFNRDIVRDYNLEDLYELVDADAWTYDKMYEMAQAVSDARDHDKRDYFSIVWGILSENANSYMMWQGSGFRLVIKDPETDLPQFCPLTENGYDAMLKIHTIQKDKNVTLLDSDILGMPSNTDDQLFYEGHALFEVGSTAGIEEMRKYDMDFGVLPMPKLNETIQDYYSSMSPTQTCAMAIPINCPDPAFTGYVTQALACESTDTLLEAYYEKTLVYKGLRQEKDERMLDLIFRSRMYDLSQVFNWAEALMLEIGNVKNTTRLQSLADQYANSVNKRIAEFLEKHELA